ncbi:hypothetical protein L2E82_39412 [Cichorium intybus]|uniref:Uncharacterized protein n=1 Tax=Cichorium intybus TaxID=13427 RepID=A0ACB9AJG9_CICIN|nr:hypothetical protein L2E82_39412 [Cichorium intybus]
MALNKKTLSLISIYALIFSTLYPRTTSSRSPAPSPTESTSSPTPTPTPSSSQSPSHSPISLSEMFELALPDIGIQKAAVAPQTEGSKIACKQLEAIEHRISEFKVIVLKRLEDPNTPEATKSCLSQCQDNFDDAINGVKTGIDSINKKDQSKANSDVSGISTDIETCNDCFMETDGEDKEVKAFNDWIQGVSKDCLNNLKNA